MSVSGLCEICTTREAEHVCDRCGSMVCDEHVDETTGYCVECVAELGQTDTDHIPQGEDLPDGVDTYEF
jgi:hypothetical protein